MDSKNVFIGIDVSKEKLDLCVLKEGEILLEQELVNSSTEIKKFFLEILKEHTAESVIVCAEYTGIYTHILCSVCSEIKLDLWLENPYIVNRSLGLTRNKNDKLDAKRISFYAKRNIDKAQLFLLPDKVIASLQLLLKERDMYVVDKAKYQAQLTDQKRFISAEDYAGKKERLDYLMNDLKKIIEKIDVKIRELIDSDDTLKRQHKLLLSVEGVGKNIATKMLVETNRFKNFKNGNSFCCHIGVAPFEYTSGSSVRSKRKVSQKADKEMKKKLHLGALSVLRKKDSELKAYYDRKVAEGKNKMSVINAIRAKIILRMFSVIKNDRLYEKKFILKPSL